MPATNHATPIVTLTVNPALDVSTSTGKVMSEHKMRCGPTRLDVGGGGVNVSRVVQRLGGNTIAIFAVGGPTGQIYRQLLDAEGIIGLPIPIEGSTRESFTVDETETREQYRFVLQGPEMQEAEWQACLVAVETAMQPGGYVVASGSLSPGIPSDFYARIARTAKQREVRCVIDASGDELAAALDEGVFLVKPSGRELRELVGRELETIEEKEDAARELVARRSAEAVALTLGAAGAVLATSDGLSRLGVPKVEVQSTVGAGDSFLGAFMLRLAEGREMDVAFRAGVAAGTATAMTPATELCHRADVERLEAELAGNTSATLPH